MDTGASGLRGPRARLFLHLKSTHPHDSFPVKPPPFPCHPDQREGSQSLRINYFQLRPSKSPSWRYQTTLPFVEQQLVRPFFRRDSTPPNRNFPGKPPPFPCHPDQREGSAVAADQLLPTPPIQVAISAVPNHPPLRRAATWSGPSSAGTPHLPIAAFQVSHHPPLVIPTNGRDLQSLRIIYSQLRLSKLPSRRYQTTLPFVEQQLGSDPFFRWDSTHPNRSFPGKPPSSPCHPDQREGSAVAADHLLPTPSIQVAILAVPNHPPLRRAATRSDYSSAGTPHLPIAAFQVSHHPPLVIPTNGRDLQSLRIIYSQLRPSKSRSRRYQTTLPFVEQQLGQVLLPPGLHTSQSQLSR